MRINSSKTAVSTATTTTTTSSSRILDAKTLSSYDDITGKAQQTQTHTHTRAVPKRKSVLYCHRSNSLIIDNVGNSLCESLDDDALLALLTNNDKEDNKEEEEKEKKRATALYLYSLTANDKGWFQCIANQMQPSENRSIRRISVINGMLHIPYHFLYRLTNVRTIHIAIDEEECKSVIACIDSESSTSRSPSQSQNQNGTVNSNGNSIYNMVNGVVQAALCNWKQYIYDAMNIYYHPVATKQADQQASELSHLNHHNDDSDKENEGDSQSVLSSFFPSMMEMKNLRRIHIIICGAGDGKVFKHMTGKYRVPEHSTNTNNHVSIVISTNSQIGAAAAHAEKLLEYFNQINRKIHNSNNTIDSL